MFNKFFLILFSVFVLGQIGAQDFGFDDDAQTESKNSFSAYIGGEASASIISYVKDFSGGMKDVSLGDIFSGFLNFSAGGSIAEGYISLNLEPSEMPVTLDEAYVRAFFGNFEIEGGLRKLTWGKADSFGVLDVINPLNYSELTDLSDLMNFKIPRPLVRLSFRFGSFSKLEGVFVPVFKPMLSAQEGRWEPAQMRQLREYEAGENITVNRPDTSTLNYAQTGLRFTTTIGSADIGAQYYYGRLTKPALTLITLNPPTIEFLYNPYHQIGIDWAQVLFGFNIRAEFAANITEDLSGDDPSVYNPHLAWSFGFDRNLFWGINLNLQCNQTIRLLDNMILFDQIPTMNMYWDLEAGSDMTATQIIASLSKLFLRDQLEARATVFWEIEARDFMIVPSLVWTKDAISVELSGGIFAGDSNGQFGQYKDNKFVKVGMSYNF